MKRFMILFLIGLCTVLSYAQDFKPCGTAMLAKRHKAQSSITRQSSQEEIRHYEGDKNGLIILVEFQDISFASEDPIQAWTDIANKPGYIDRDSIAIGSVSDYFYDQSYGKFKLTFDVVGPVKAAHNHEYYGENKDWGDNFWFDKNVGELVEEACKGVADKVNFADYDWDNDGEVEQVFLLYAGRGENDYARKDSAVIWPHMASLMLDWEGYEKGIVLQGKLINVYACSNEIISNVRFPHLAGIGTFCHEFSHCLGLPDLYNTKSNNSVLGRYDLMDYGSYLGEGWRPVGYSSYERYCCGWLDPVPIDNPAGITSLLPLHTNPDARIYRSSDDANDYYLIEYRQKAESSWDEFYPETGLQAWHIDYDKTAWMNNEVNNDPSHLRVERMTVDKIPTAIADISSEDKQIIGVYDLHGRPADASSSRFQIIRYSDGTTKKKMAAW